MQAVSCFSDHLDLSHALTVLCLSKGRLCASSPDPDGLIAAALLTVRHCRMVCPAKAWYWLADLARAYRQSEHNPCVSGRYRRAV